MKRELPVKIPLYEQIYTHILQEVRSGRLKRGERVPSENELSAQFKVSRITSKKALEMLEQAAIIERTRGKGSFVRHDLPNLAVATDTETPPTSTLEEPSATAAIGVIFSDIGDGYGLKMLYTIQEYAAALGFYVVLRMSHERQEIEEVAIRTLLKFGVQGLIIMPVHGEFYNSELVQLVFSGFPVVLVDRYLAGIPARAIYTRHRQAAQEIVDHLLDQGHRQIAFLSSPAQNTSSIEERIQGYSTALASRGISVKAEYMLTQLTSTTNHFSQDCVEDDVRLITHFVLEHPEITAFFACEYNIAILLQRVLNHLDKRVPEDCAIVCFDSPDIQLSEFSFTHVLQDEIEIGRVAVDALIEQINGEKANAATAPTGQHLIDYTFVQGKSSRSVS